jgi:tetratricopeptide (TPR) repeat protein
VDELRGLELIYEKALHPEVAYMFKHALTHDVAYESVRVERRMALHCTIGRTIEELYADRLAEHFETLAHHFTRGEDWERALAYHERAADKAEEHHASRAVVEHARAGLDIAKRLGERVGAPQRLALWQRLGRAHLHLSEFADSAAAYEQAADHAAGDEERSLSLSEAANSHIWAHHYDAGRRVLAAALDLARSCGSEVAEAVALSTEGFVRAVLDARVDDLATLAGRAMALAARRGNESAEGLARMYIMMHAEWVGRFPDALEGARTSLALGRKLRSPQLVIWPTWFGGKARCCTGDFGGALVQLEEAYSVCDRIGDRAWKSRMLNTIGWCYAEIGAPERAGEFNERARTLARELGDPEILANAAINLARNHLALGDVDRAAAELAPIEAELLHGTDPWMRWRWSLHAYDVRARIALARGAFDAALAAANLEHEGALRHGVPKLTASAALLRGETLLALERWDDAELVLVEARTLGERLGWVRGQWDAARLLAVHARRRGATARADEHRARARAVAERAAASLTDDALRRGLLDAAVRES